MTVVCSKCILKTECVSLLAYKDPYALEDLMYNLTGLTNYERRNITKKNTYKECCFCGRTKWRKYDYDMIIPLIYSRCLY